MRDWDDAYANSAHIPGSDKLPAQWAERAAAYRAGLKDFRADIAYGAGERQRLDLILPDGDSKGLVVFVHGGYWMRFDKSTWTDLAEGARQHGWTVALPSYTLTPAARISNITAGLSGPAIKPIALRMVYEAAHTVEIPVIGMGGITTAEDVVEFMLAGAAAVEVGTANFWDPCATEKIVDGLQRWCFENRVKRITDIIGTLET